MPLDPIVSLSVAIAEAPGSYAFLLGSGVSRDAGVPTGGEVFWRAVGDLYRLDETVDDTPSESDLADWLTDKGREDIGYSAVLELIAPDAATRRDYLSKHFEGVEPGPTHERLADLAARDYVRIFVTTNFDRLLERALQARAIEPVVVTADEDLQVAPAREHARCYVLKPHGDYLQETIRNTPAELADLPPAMTVELAEVFSRYGLVVLGYSGSDEALTRTMRGRRSRYGVYWVARGALVEPAGALVEAVAGRVIERPGAAEFLADLDRRLEVFAAQPTGETPAVVNDEVVLLLRRGDRVGLRELLRRERREYDERLTALVEDRHGETPTEAIADEVHDALLPALERRLASLLPLALHDDTGLLDAEMEAIAAFMARQARRGGYTFWSTLPDWCAWWLGFTLGAFLVRQRDYHALTAIFTPQVTTDHGTARPLVDTTPGDAGNLIGISQMKQVDNQRYFAPWWESLRRDLPVVRLVADRYPELTSTDDEPLRSLVEFDFLHNIALGVRGHGAVSHWSMYSANAEAFAARIHSDARLRERVAAGTGLPSVEDFDEKAPAALESAHALGHFPNRDAVTVLRTGSR